MPKQSPDALRLFYALWPDATLRTELMRLQAPLSGRMIAHQNLHLTLAFLGQQPASCLPALQDILMRLPRADVVMTLDRFGYFNRSRIAWAGMHQTPPALLALRDALSQALDRHGVRFDNQGKFTPHVTLARDAAPPPDFAFAPLAWRADEVALVQSDTRAEGARYTVLAARSLLREVWTANERGPEPAAD